MEKHLHKKVLSLGTCHFIRGKNNFKYVNIFRQKSVEVIKSFFFKFQCEICGKQFIHNSSFYMHKLAHSGIKVCNMEIFACGMYDLESFNHVFFVKG